MKHQDSTPCGAHSPSFEDPACYTPFFSRVAAGDSSRLTHLLCEQVPLERVAKAIGTPVYLYSHASIEAAFRALDRGLSSLPHTVCYAVKANANLALLRLLARLGSGFDVVSGGELDRLRRVGASGRRIVFSGVGKTREEIREALAYPGARRAPSGILLFNIESEAELDILAEEAVRHIARGGRPPAVSVRVNPDVQAGGHPHIATGHRQHKFGLDWPAAHRLYLAHRRARSVRWRGVSAHIGSQITSLAPFRSAFRRLAGYYRELVREGVGLKYLDFGGGLGIRYNTERPPSSAAYIRAVSSVAGPLGCHLLLEPGRAIIGAAGVLLTRVLYTKQSRGRTFVVVDAAMNDLIRPALYAAVHSITKVVEERSSGMRGGLVDIVGPVCETSDCFLRDWPLGEAHPGDLLAVWCAGAYGFALASNYNVRPRPAEVLAQGRSFRLIRRRESRADLLRSESF